MDDQEPFDEDAPPPLNDIAGGIAPTSASSRNNMEDEHADHDLHRSASVADDDDDDHNVAHARGPSSLADDDSDTTHPHHHHRHHLVPPLPERTLKEKLVERERQKRIETERARLKRQFALSNSGGGEGELQQQQLKEDGSLVGTVGEGSSVAAGGLMNDDDIMGMMNHPAPEEKTEKLGYAMERFLSEREQREVANGDAAAAAALLLGASALPVPTETEEPGGVVMERFLSEPVVVMDEPPRPPDDDEHHSDVVLVVDNPPQGNGNLPVGDRAPASAASVTFDDDVVDHHHHSMGVQSNPPASHRSMGSEVSATAGSLALSSVGEPDDGGIGAMMNDSMEVRTNASSTNNNRLMEIMDHPTDVTVVENLVGFTTNTGERDSPSQARASSSISSLPSTNTHDHNSNHQPVVTRILRLTEREIQEMAAIEEASIGNAPPSEREDTLSEVGDLVSPFREMDHRDHDHLGSFSVNTRTTASVSNTSLGGNQSDPRDLDDDHERRSMSQDEQHQVVDEHHHNSIDEHNSIDRIATASVSSHLALSDGDSEGDVSVTAHPPSVIANEEQPSASMLVVDDHDDDDEIYRSPAANEDGVPISLTEAAIPTTIMPDMPTFDDDGPLDAEASAMANAGVVNRRLRPGMTTTPTSRGGAQFRPQLHHDVAISPTTPSREMNMKRALSMPEKMHVTLDGFDYDKYDYNIPHTPQSNGDSFGDLPRGDDHLLWTPNTNKPVVVEGAAAAMMTISPLHSSRKPAPPSLGIASSGDPKIAAELDLTGSAYEINYGSCGNMSVSSLTNVHTRAMQPQSSDSFSDRDALLPSSEPKLTHSKADSVFSFIRSDSTSSVREIANEADVYNHSSIWKRAFPERFFALLVTLIIEIPVLLMISGGSDRLCMLVGRRRYQLLIGFLPLSSAISGNCGLQASTLTTRAISHCQVTVENFRAWFRTEVLAATMLGFGMGGVLGICGYMVSDFDLPFGFTIFIAQFISIVTAGVTGTLAPLIFTFIFRRDSGKWGGPLETAIQDIVGSFAMVVLSYHVLALFGPHTIDPADMCGSGGTDGGA
jgi:hypothetical protein